MTLLLRNAGTAGTHLDVGVHGGVAPRPHHQAAPVLVAVTHRHVAAQVQTLGLNRKMMMCLLCQVRNLGRGVARLLREYCPGQPHQAESLETHLLVALLLHVDKQLAVKVLALNKLLHTDGFQANTNKSKMNR